MQTVSVPQQSLSVPHAAPIAEHMLPELLVLVLLDVLPLVLEPEAVEPPPQYFCADPPATVPHVAPQHCMSVVHGLLSSRQPPAAGEQKPVGPQS